MRKLEKNITVDVTDYGRIIESGWGEDAPMYLKKNMEKFDIEYPQFKKFKIIF